MIKLDFNGASKSDLSKVITAAVEKEIGEKVRFAAVRHGGVRVRFAHKADGSLDSVQFEGGEAAVQAARKVLEK